MAGGAGSEDLSKLERKLLLSLTDWRIMGFIEEHGPCNIEYISDHTLCSKETLKVSLRKLIQKGYIREDNKGNYV